ncbi:hypothetical protein Tco_0891780 [Tanacetum coccineum]|uniref:FRIGIDA-like protein n=1 Tax=Tanacetum coccineum TaxID=301880 RepID=A0ABQ5C746_9ASTR
MTLDIHNWSSSAHQELHKIIKDENFPIINQVEARVQNFEIQFLKEATKFVRDFKSLAKEADESLAKHKALEHEIERLLRAVVSQNIMSIVQNPSVVDTSDLQTELECTIERLENCIIKKETEYAKFGMIGTKNMKNANMTKFHTIKLIMTCNKRLNGCKLSWEISRVKVIPKVGETNDLLKPVTSNSAPSTRESKVVKNDNVLAPGMFRIYPSKTSSVDNGMAKTRRPQAMSNTTNDRVPSTSKSSCI